MTKVQAIVRVLEDHDGTADLKTIYQEIARHRPITDTGTDWQAGIRGVLYRELRNGRTFRKVDSATYQLMPSRVVKIEVLGGCAYVVACPDDVAVLINDRD